MTLEIRHALRRLRKKPAFSLAAIATLALGIGFNTVVFSLVNFLLLRPLPISDPENVVSLQSRGRPNFSFPNYLDVRSGNEVFTDIAALRVMPMHVNAGGEKWRLWGYLVTGSYFDLLGIQAWRGRLLSPSDDVTTGAHPVVVVSHASWQRRFGSDPGLVGSTVRVNGYPFTVVGIAPPGFAGTERVLSAEFWVPFSMIREIEGRDWREWRRTSNAWVLGRLKPGVSREEAEASLSAVAGRLALDYPEENEGLSIDLAPAGLLGSLLRRPIVGVAGALLVVSGLTLLVACANLSNLLLAQSGRSPEGVRAPSRPRLFPGPASPVGPRRDDDSRARGRRDFSHCLLLAGPRARRLSSHAGFSREHRPRHRWTSDGLRARARARERFPLEPLARAFGSSSGPRARAQE